jgi:hypothetical protein
MGGWYVALPCNGIAIAAALVCRGRRGSVSWRIVVCQGELMGGGSVGVRGSLVGATMTSPMVGGIARCKSDRLGRGGVSVCAFGGPHGGGHGGR